MLLHQELSAPQVISYLMEYDDHFTSHRFVSFNWSGPEKYVNSMMPLSGNPLASDNIVHTRTNTQLTPDSVMSAIEDDAPLADSSASDCEEAFTVSGAPPSELLNHSDNDLNMHTVHGVNADDTRDHGTHNDEVFLVLDSSNHLVT